MDSFQSPKSTLTAAAGRFSALLENAAGAGIPADRRCEAWRTYCDELPRLLDEDIVRVAVVGSIKSGKSTFANSLFRADHLKRGAGVVTSIVTRVRGDKKLKAVLYFKTWEEINAEIAQAMVLLPTLERSSEEAPFDIRNDRDRKALAHAIAALDADLLMREGERNLHTVLISLYLQGYERVTAFMPASEKILIFNAKRFSEHRQFVADDTLAVYLRDLEIRLDADGLDPSIEIADCQGSDSPNPLHLSMIQDYLDLAHLLVYVISSRTGLRRADLRFLTMIQKMGIMENVLFVLNCDFSEHDSLDGLTAVRAKVLQELSLMVPAPEVYTFSSLYTLYRSIRDDLSEKEARRLAHWEAESELIDFSNDQRSQFMSRFTAALEIERYSLLMKNPVERMTVMSAAALNWSETQEELLTNDASSTGGLLQRLRDQQQRIGQIHSLVKSTFNGAVTKLKGDQKTAIDRFFYSGDHDLISRVVGFIDGYSVGFHNYEDKLAASGFASALYLVFQDFRQALDLYITETIHPEVVRFTRSLEKGIIDHLMSVAEPFQAMVMGMVEESSKSISSASNATAPLGDHPLERPDIQAIKRVSGLSLPPAGTTLRYSAIIKTEAIARLGFYRVVKWFKTVLKKPLRNAREDEMAALQDGVRRIKRETEKSIRFHFKSYRENIKFQYISKLIDAVAAHMNLMLNERFDAFGTDLVAIETLVTRTGVDRDAVLTTLKEISAGMEEIQSTLKGLRNGITSEEGP
ncbi:MAG: dynamin family protein [Pseudomonadota bacterium]